MTDLETDSRATTGDSVSDGADNGAAATADGAVRAQAAPADAGGLQAPVGFGRALGQARERMGLSVADMAARLRLHPRQISALEEEQLSALPEAPFVRGFVRNYAKELQLDPAPLLADLATRLPTAASLGDGMGSAGLSSSDVRSAGVDGKSRVTVVGSAVAALVVLGLIGWVSSLRAPSGETTSASAPGQATAGAPAIVSAAPSTEPVGAPTPAAPDASAASPGSPNSAGATSESGALASVPTQSASTPAPSVASSPVLNGVRLLIGDRPSWIEITQADGAVILSGLQEPGTERRIAPVQPPLRLVIGNSSAVRLEYRGKPIDLKSHARADDLARLTLE